MMQISHHDSGTSEQQKLYSALDQKLRSSPFGGSAAQTHGIACGLVCRDVQAADLEAIKQRLSFTDSLSGTAFDSLREMGLRDLNQAEFGFDLWLPDVEKLSTQLEALAEWSQGFLIGLMHDGPQIRAQLSAELNDSVQDIMEISGLEIGSSDSTEDEVAFMELREYLRTVTQLLYEELNPDRPIESAQE